MRSVVMTQMKKPMLKRIMSPMRFPSDIFNFMMRGRGKKNMIRSLMRLEMAFVQLCAC